MAGNASASRLTKRAPHTPLSRLGEFSLHNTLCTHSAAANASDGRRIGLGISYIPTHVRHIGSFPVSAMLARGEDSHGNFVLERLPTGDDAADAVAMTERVKTSFGRLDIPVNNATDFIDDGAGADIPEADWKRSLDVNLTRANRNRPGALAL